MASIARNENESFEEFKARRSGVAQQDKINSRPKVFWNSYYDGTYTNPEKQAAKKAKSK